MVNILGISAFYHDSTACLVRDGEVIAAAQEERFTRRKNDPNFPEQAIGYCLREGGITPQQLDYVAFYEKPLLKFERLVKTYAAFAPRGLASFLTAMPLWLQRKLFIKQLIRSELEYDGPILFPEHHESHAMSAFYPSPFTEAAILTIDGVGEYSTTFYGVGRGHEVQILADIQFPHSLGLLYSAFTYYTGFKVNSGEYKVMGLAPYGQPTFAPLIYEHLIDIKPDGSFRLNLEFFDYAVGSTMTNERFHALFGGPPRLPETWLTQRDMDLARSVQEVIEDVILRMARHIRVETRMRHLCLAGGVALNCVANGKLLRTGLFDNLWIQPAAGDAGGALGAALGVWHQYLGNVRVAPSPDGMNGALLGPQFDREEIARFLRDRGIAYEEYPDDELVERAADLIAQEKVIGWFQGRMEFGPRALGARSILGDARSPKMQAHMNIKIKFREGFRPFAPSVLEERAGEWFDLDRPSPYMLLVADIRRERQRPMSEAAQALFGLDKLHVIRSDIPAVTHIDYSARIQTVGKESNPLFRKLLLAFDRKYHCPVIVNTSFNVRGEPLVCTPQDAYRCFMRTNIDFLIIGNFVLDRTKQAPVEERVDWRKEFALD